MHKSLTFSPQVPTRLPLRALGLALTLSLLSLVGACAQDSGNAPVQVAGQGYQSGDGSVTTWTPAKRTEPVALVGTDYAGQSVDTTEYYGEVVVLNTWYAACPPCRAEAPDLVALEEQFAPDSVKFLGINRTDEVGAVAAFEREYGVTWPSIDDKNGAAVAALAGVVPIKAVPTTVVLDRQGRVTARILGQIDKTTLKTLISEALGEDA